MKEDVVAEVDRERGPAEPEEDHGGSADDDQPAVFKHLDKESAAEVKRVLKRAE